MLLTIASDHFSSAATAGNEQHVVGRTEFDRTQLMRLAWRYRSMVLHALVHRWQIPHLQLVVETTGDETFASGVDRQTRHGFCSVFEIDLVGDRKEGSFVIIGTFFFLLGGLKPSNS